MNIKALTPQTGEVRNNNRDILFAAVITFILAIFFLPVPSLLIDVGLALSIAFSVLILMVSLWIQKPLEFSAFPTILLVATLLRLSLNIATTRLILSHGSEGTTAAGYIIAGFSRLVMSGDFVIGLIVFSILITVNFLVITKGATRIAEVGARFTLDSIPGKQMAIDADLSAGLINDKEAHRRRRELEEESSFFGSMDGASKFVRGDAIAGMIILGVNIFGGIIIGVTRHNMPLGMAADVFTKLSVGEGLVSQIPALIVSLAAGLLVSKGGTRGTAESAVFGQLGAYPRALFSAAFLMIILALIPGLPASPFAILAMTLTFIGYTIPRKLAEAQAKDAAKNLEQEQLKEKQAKESVIEQLNVPYIELVLGKQISVRLIPHRQEIANRIAKMRRKFARQYGIVIPEIELSDDLDLDSKGYEIRIRGIRIAGSQVRIGDLLVLIGEGPRPDILGDEIRDPAFGVRALWVSEQFAPELKRQGYSGIDNLSVILTHLSEALRNNLAQLLSYKDIRHLFDRLEPEYRKLLDEICPAHISLSALHSVFRLLLAERISIRNLSSVLEAVAEIAPHVRRAEQILEHIRMRIGQQICGDLAPHGPLHVLRLGNRWDMVFQQALKRDAKGDIVELDLDPRLIEQFTLEASPIIRQKMDEMQSFALITPPDARPYVRMIIERLFPTVPVLSHLEIARSVEIQSLGTLS